MTQQDVIDAVTTEVKALANFLTDDDYSRAAIKASQETGWSFPVSDASNFRCFWMVERTKRHLISFLLTESASKFKYKQINLDQRFDQYKKMLVLMDEQFKDAQQESPFEFTNANATSMFGTYVEGGFSYDFTGNDTTYDN